MNTQPYSGGEQGLQSGSNASSASSLLVVDCGTVFTKVSLLGLVEGQYRLMARGEAPTTVNPPYEDVTEGIIQAINVIEFITGRRFVVDKRIISPEQPNGDGVDVFISTMSTGDPLRLVVIGAVSPALEGLTKQAVSGLYVQAETISAPSFTAATTPAPVGAGVAGGQWSQQRITQEWERQSGRIREIQPQVALIVGLAEGPSGPISLQEACQLLVNAARDRGTQSFGWRIGAGRSCQAVLCHLCWSTSVCRGCTPYVARDW